MGMHCAQRPFYEEKNRRINKLKLLYVLTKLKKFFRKNEYFI